MEGKRLITLIRLINSRHQMHLGNRCCPIDAKDNTFKSNGQLDCLLSLSTISA